jgi:hypothetical protein
MISPKLAVWVFAEAKVFPALNDLKNRSVIDIASGPLIRITAIAPIPGAVAGAMIVSFLLRFFKFTLRR